MHDLETTRFIKACFKGGSLFSQIFREFWIAVHGVDIIPLISNRLHTLL